MLQYAPRGCVVSFLPDGDIGCLCRERSPMKILVVDDEPAIIKMFKMAARDAHSVDGATDMEEGLRLADSGGYDFVVLDYIMRNRDGRWFMQNAKLPPKTRVLLLTGRNDPMAISGMIKLGVFGYLLKPTSILGVLRYLEMNLRGGEPAAV